MKKLIIIFLIALHITSFGISQKAHAKENLAGTLFGDPVSKKNFNIMMWTVLSFRSPWGTIPRTRAELEKRIWDELLLSYEAFRRNIPVSQKEIEEKINAILKKRKVSFDRKAESDVYAQWIMETFHGSVDMFENQMRHLVQVTKLHEQVVGELRISVTGEEAFQEFLNEQNSLSIEVAEFDTLHKALEFYQKVQKDPSAWDQALKKDQESPKEERTFRRPGFVTLEFLIDIWEIPKKAVFAMIEMNMGDFYPPKPIYRGYGVFKILDIRRADESVFPERKDYYFDQLRRRKKFQGSEKWLKNLRQEADIQIYIDPPPEIFP